jgi:hypothetical protein
MDSGKVPFKLLVFRSRPLPESRCTRKADGSRRFNKNPKLVVSRA